MKQFLLSVTLGLGVALSPLIVEAQPKKPPTTPAPVPTPTPTPTPVPTPMPLPPVTSPPQSSSGKGDFTIYWGEAAKEDDKADKDKQDQEKPPPPGTIRLTWGTEASEEDAKGNTIGGRLGGLQSSRVVVIFVTTIKRLPLIRRIDFEARRKQLEKKRAEQLQKKAKK